MDSMSEVPSESSDDMADAFNAAFSAEDEGAEAPADAEELAPEQPEAEAPASDEPVYTFLIDGEERQLTHSQAQDSLLMQSDYTRKTQDLARQRQELEHAERIAQALETDPERTIRALQEALLDEQGTQEDEYLDPEEARWREFDQFKAQMQEREVQAEINRTLATLAQTYGKFDENELIDYAVKHETPNLEVALAAMSFEKMRGVAAKQKADQAVVDSKRTAPPVAGGHGVAAGSSTPGAAPSGSIEEALAQAEAMHGLTL